MNFTAWNKDNGYTVNKRIEHSISISTREIIIKTSLVQSLLAGFTSIITGT